MHAYRFRTFNSSQLSLSNKREYTNEIRSLAKMRAGFFLLCVVLLVPVFASILDFAGRKCSTFSAISSPDIIYMSKIYRCLKFHKFNTLWLALSFHLHAKKQTRVSLSFFVILSLSFCVFLCSPHKLEQCFFLYYFMR